MLSKDCRVTRRHIDELELGERPAENASAHLSTCAPCREFRAERTEMRRLMGGLEPVSAPPDFQMRLRARIAREEASSLPEPLFTRLFRTPALAAIALFVVVGGTVVWVAQRDEQQTTPIATHRESSPPATVTSVAADDTGDGAQVAQDENRQPTSNQLASVPGKSRPPSRGPRSRDFSVLPPDSVRQNDQAFVNVPSKPVGFALEDEQGNSRRISLPPVSFGAQNLVDNRVPVSYTGRVW